MATSDDLLTNLLEMLNGSSRKDAVWAKGTLISGYDPLWRRDSFGWAMRYSDYGEATDYGWEIDHIDPNGPDELWNLQPLNWLNNRRKSDKSPTMLGFLLGGTKR